MITKVNCPSEDEIGILKDNTILIGMLNPSKNKNQIDKIINKKIKPFSLELLPRITRAQSMDVLSSQSIWLDIEQLLIVLQNLKKLCL